MGALVLLSIPAYSDQLAMTLDQTIVIAPAGGVYQPGLCTNSNGSGSCVIFTGTITTDGFQDYFLDALFITMNASNPDGGMDVFDNTVTPQTAATGNQFFLNATMDSGTLGIDGPISDPDTYTGGLFEVDVAPNTPTGLYRGIATLEYTDLNDCTDPSNPCTVSVPFGVNVPEPGAFPFAVVGLVAMAAVRRRFAVRR